MTTDKVPRSARRRRAELARIRLSGLGAIDRRTTAARVGFELKRELVTALGGADEISPQKARLVDMVVRASLYLDHIDSFLLAQENLVDITGIHPALAQRQAVADHVVRLLNQLGLDRVARKVGDLQSYRAQYETKGNVQDQAGS
jgi:hypothetical protein